jgi:exopolysaccharide production protein ExoZ
MVLVQVLRGLAALLVLLGHLQAHVVQMAESVGESVSRITFLPGGFGVDLFFTISGFIMVVSSRDLFQQTGSWKTFLYKRASRLVPLYWFATLAFLPVILLGRHAYEGDLAQALGTSLFFIPYLSYPNTTLPFPLHTLGWSLNYEVFFYVVFACFLSLSRHKAVAGVALAMTAIVLLGHLTEPSNVALTFWSQPIVLEFAMGLLLGAAWLRWNPRLNAMWAWLVVAACIAWLMADPLGVAVKIDDAPTPNGFARLLGWGAPAALLLCVAVFFERGNAVRSQGPFGSLAKLGDWSYSLYLMHPFGLIAISKLWMLLGLYRIIPWPVFGLVLIGSSIVLAAACYRYIERPTQAWLRRWSPKSSSK